MLKQMDLIDLVSREFVPKSDNFVYNILGKLHPWLVVMQPEC